MKHLEPKLHNIISGYRINNDDADWLLSLLAQPAAVPDGLKRYEPEPHIVEENGRLKVDGAGMMEKPDGRWVRLEDVLAAAPQPSQAEPQQAEPDLPGMWHESDLTGGATDCETPVSLTPIGQMISDGIDAYLSQTLEPQHHAQAPGVLTGERALFDAWWTSVGPTIGKVAAWAAWQARAALSQVKETAVAATPGDAEVQARCENIASQCRATASSQLAKMTLVDEGNGTLQELLLDAAMAIERAALAQQGKDAERYRWLCQQDFADRQWVETFEEYKALRDARIDAAMQAKEQTK